MNIRLLLMSATLSLLCFAGVFAFPQQSRATRIILPTNFTIPNPNNPCAVKGVCTDNVLFLPGIEGSRLYYRGVGNIEHQVWEPDFYTDIPYLAMNANGTSKYVLYTKDIIGRLYGNTYIERKIAKSFGQNLQVYSKFETFMNHLVASSTIKEWKAYPYDWRYDVRDIVANGTLTEEPDGSIKRVYLTNVLKKLASTSLTGRVTIIAHSNGGLVAKALAIYLGSSASKYIDNIILVGTPQWGTPSDIGAMLHGDGQTQGLGLIMRGSAVRAVTQKMPDAYDLLPSPAYFEHIATPVATFSMAGALSGKFAIKFGKVISSFKIFTNFIEDIAGLDAQAGDLNDLKTPIPLSNTLIDKAIATHAVLDVWTPPKGITVTAIAGWGQDTTETLSYTTKYKEVCNSLRASVFEVFIKQACDEFPYLEHVSVGTQDGDGTVVSPSAVGRTADRLFFNSKDFSNQFLKKITHKDLVSATPIQDVIKNVLTDKKTTPEAYITKTKPTNDASPIKIRFSTHSPVNFFVTDALGKQSGVLPIPGTDFSGVKQDIPDSSVHVFDDEEYVSVPQTGTYHIVVSGYATGSATIQLEKIQSNGSATTTAIFTNIPTTASSTIIFTVTNGTPSAPAVDINGDGATDFSVASSASGSDSVTYIRSMISEIDTLDIPHSMKKVLSMRLYEIERQIISYKKISQEFHKYSKFHSNKRNSKMFMTIRKPSLFSQLASIKKFVEFQYKSSAIISLYKKDNKQDISSTNAEIILNMIDQLKTLI